MWDLRHKVNPVLWTCLIWSGERSRQVVEVCDLFCHSIQILKHWPPYLAAAVWSTCLTRCRSYHGTTCKAHVSDGRQLLNMGT